MSRGINLIIKAVEGIGLQSLIRTHTIPYDAFPTIAELIKCRITVSHWCEKRGGIKEVKHYGNPEWEGVRLFERWGHVMVNEDGIAQKVEKLRKEGKPREMTADEMNIAIRRRSDMITRMRLSKPAMTSH
jgi:hypothetical protein